MGQQLLERQASLCRMAPPRELIEIGARRRAVNESQGFRE